MGTVLGVNRPQYANKLIPPIVVTVCRRVRVVEKLNPNVDSTVLLAMMMAVDALQKGSLKFAEAYKAQRGTAKSRYYEACLNSTGRCARALDCTSAAQLDARHGCCCMDMTVHTELTQCWRGCTGQA